MPPASNRWSWAARGGGAAIAHAAEHPLAYRAFGTHHERAGPDASQPCREFQRVLEVPKLVNQTQLIPPAGGEHLAGGQFPDLTLVQGAALGHHRDEIIVNLVDQPLEFLSLFGGWAAPEPGHVL